MGRMSLNIWNLPMAKPADDQIEDPSGKLAAIGSQAFGTAAAALGQPLRGLVAGTVSASSAMLAAAVADIYPVVSTVPLTEKV